MTEDQTRVGTIWKSAALLLASAYLRLLVQATNRPTTFDEIRPEDSSEKSREPLDFGSGIPMTCAGQDDDNPLAGKDLEDGK